MDNRRFNSFRTTNDGAMIADVGFKKQLQALDKELDVVWDNVANKWEIWKFNGQGDKVKKRLDSRARHVMTVQTQDRTFREVGADILLNLQKNDTSKYSLKEIMGYFDQMDENLQRANRKRLDDKLSDCSKELSWHTRGQRFQIPRRFMNGTVLKTKLSNSKKLERIIANGH